jgi:nuclear GTP-binding protein
MAKFINKPKGRSSKRMKLNMKYKINKKVKDHNKRVKKEAR